MRRGKKFLALLLAVVLCFGAVPVSLVSVDVYAAEEQVSSYGEQLTEQQREIYDTLVDKYIGEDGLSNGVTEDLNYSFNTAPTYDSMEAMQTDVWYAAFAFIYDYPQLMWISGAGLSYWDLSTSYKLAKVTFAKHIMPTEDEIVQFNSGVQTAVNEIKNNLSENASVYEKYLAIHDWICQNAYYDYDGLADSDNNLQIYTSYPIFHGEGGVVCDGYSKAFKILCDQLELTCMRIIGSAGTESSGYGLHAWNSVLMEDGNWYGVDVTWDDDEGSMIFYDYFLCGKKSSCFTGLTYGEDHLEDGQIVSGVTYEYPDVAEYGYNSYTGDISYSYENGVLNIYGKGAIPEYSKVDRIPWYQYGDEITSVVIEEGITNISKGCLAGLDNLESLTIPYVGVTRDATDDNAKLSVIFNSIIPASLKKVVVTNDDNLENSAFYGCSSLQSIILNDGMTSIGNYSFYRCSSLTEMVIPDSVTNIGKQTFGYCTNLKRITLPFIGKNIDDTEYSECGSVFAYVFGGSSYAWPLKLQSVIITKDTTIPYKAFSNFRNFEAIYFLADVAIIDQYAFISCASLQAITFYGDAPSNINEKAFSACGVITANIPYGNDTWTDSIKQDYGAERIIWNETNTTDTVAKISSAKISLGDKIAMKFMVTLDDSVSEDDYMRVTVNDKTTEIKVKNATVSVSNLTGEEKYVFVCEVNAKEMTKPIQAQMVVDDVAGSTVTYSVKKYADAILNLASGTYESEKTMLRAMLNYGGYAQTYFEDESDLANDGLYETSEDPVLNLETIDLEAYSPSGTNTEKLTATLLLESETELRFYFSPEDGRTLNDYSFEVSGTDKSLVTGTKTGKSYVAIPEITANELQDMYTVTIRSNDTGEVFATVTYGAMSYVKSVLNNSSNDNLKNLVKALYLYNQAAVDYSK